MIKARLIVAVPLLCGSQHLNAGDAFAEMTFPSQEVAVFFKNRLNWSSIHVELGEAVNPRRDLVALQYIPQAEPHAAALESLGIITLGDLAAFNAKALQKVIGTADAGPLIRAAKRVIAGGSAAEPRRLGVAAEQDADDADDDSSLPDSGSEGQGTAPGSDDGDKTKSSKPAKSSKAKKK